MLTVARKRLRHHLGAFLVLTVTAIVSLDPIYIYFDMDEATYLKYNKLWFEGKRPSSRDTANPVQVTLANETRPSHDGKMDFLDNRMDVSTATLRSRAIIPNKDLSILPGQFGRVRLIGSAPYEALLLPDSAIATDQSRKIVFVVNNENVVEVRPVVLGPLDEGLRVVREGLKPGDKVELTPCGEQSVTLRKRRRLRLDEVLGSLPTNGISKSLDKLEEDLGDAIVEDVTRR